MSARLDIELFSPSGIREIDASRRLACIALEHGFQLPPYVLVHGSSDLVNLMIRTFSGAQTHPLDAAVPDQPRRAA